jgi:hypothetical protein
LKAVARPGGIIPSEKLTVAAVGRYNSEGDRVLLDHARRAGPSEQLRIVGFRIVLKTW